MPGPISKLKELFSKKTSSKQPDTDKEALLNASIDESMDSSDHHTSTNINLFIRILQKNTLSSKDLLELSTLIEKIKAVSPLTPTDTTQLLAILFTKLEALQKDRHTIHAKVIRYANTKNLLQDLQLIKSLCHTLGDRSYLLTIFNYHTFEVNDTLKDLAPTLQCLNLLYQSKQELPFDDTILHQIDEYFTAITALSKEGDELVQKCRTLKEAESKLTAEIEHFSKMLERLQTRNVFYSRRDSLNKKRTLLDKRREKHLASESLINVDINKYGQRLTMHLNRSSSFLASLQEVLTQTNVKEAFDQRSFLELTTYQKVLDELITLLTHFQTYLGQQ